MSSEDRPIFLLSPPRLDWALRGKANFRSREAQAPDARRARREWAQLAGAIVAAGGEVLVCPPHPEQPLTGMIYTAEAGEFFRRPDGRPGFLLPNMASAHRRAEASWIGQVLTGWGFVVEAIGQAGRPRWEAQGDAIRAGAPAKIVHTFGLGPDARSEAGAYQQVAERMGGAHILIEFRADPWFHGNTFLNIYRGAKELLMIVCPDALSPEEYARLREFMSEARVHEITRAESLGYDTNALQVNQTVIAPMTLSEGSDRALQEVGLEPQRLDLSELFLKGGGAPVCLSNRLWGLRLDEVPESARWSLYPDIAAHS